MTPEIKVRLAIEKSIITKVIDDGIKAGYEFTLDDGDDFLKRDQLIAEITDLEITRLYFHPGGGKEANGWVMFVQGNDGHDVISDYTTNLEGLLKPANDLADKYERGEFDLVVY